MALLEKVTTGKESTPEIKQVFEMMEQAVGSVPEPLRMLAISPGLFNQQARMIGYYRNHERLSPELLTFIRYGAANHFDNQACIDFNGSILKRQGMSDAELSAVLDEPARAPLEDHEKALLAFVIRGLGDQQGATAVEVKQLLDQGWRESDILDAVNHGFSMYAAGRMLKLFGMV